MANHQTGGMYRVASLRALCWVRCSLSCLSMTFQKQSGMAVRCFYVRSSTKGNPQRRVNGLLIHPSPRLETTLTIMIPLSLTNLEILTSYNNSPDLLTTESLLIRKLKTCLNGSSSASQLFTQ